MKYSTPMFRIGLIFAVLLCWGQCGSAYSGDSIDSSIRTIDQAYPKRRYIGGGFSAFWGGFAVYRGIDFLSDNSITGLERGLSFALFGFGAVRVIDGGARILSSTQVEKDILRYRSNPNKEFGEALLKEASQHERKMRFFRATFSGATAVSYLVLYSTGKSRFRRLIWPGLALTGVTLFRLLSRSPEERAWNKFTSGERLSRIEFHFGVTDTQIVTQCTLTF